MAVPVTIGSVTPLAVAILLLVVAAFVLFLDVRAQVHRAFALLLLVKALALGLYFFESTDLGFRLRPYAFIALPFAALHFAIVYVRRHGRPRRLPWMAIGIAIGLAAGILEALYLLDHGLWSGSGRIGPLAVFAFLDSPALAAVALLLALQARSAVRPPSSSAFLVAALALSVQPLFFATFRVADVVLDWSAGRPGHGSLFAVLETAAGAVTLLAVGLVMAITARVRHHQRRSAAVSFGLWWSAMASGAAVSLLFWAEARDPGNVLLGLRDADYVFEVLLVANALWALVLPVLVTYALIRYRLFDAEVRVRFAVKGTTIAAFFVATFFVVGKLVETGAQELFEDNNYNWVVGAVVTGLLLFLISPLQSLAERLAHRAVPGGKPMTHLPHADRVRLYREQLEVAWSDGTLTPKERLLFARLQERLGLTAEEALALETEVIGNLPKKPASRSRGVGS